MGDENLVKELMQYIREIAQHQVDYPTHGTNCACMDRFSQAMRADIRQVLESFDKSGRLPSGSHEGLQAKFRVTHVLQMIVRNL